MADKVKAPEVTPVVAPVTKSEYPKKVSFINAFDGSLDTGKIRWKALVSQKEIKASRAKGGLPEREVPNEIVFNWLKKFGVINA